MFAEDSLFGADPHDRDLLTEGAVGDAHDGQFSGAAMRRAKRMK